MISTRALNYAKILFSMNVKEDSITLAKNLLEVDELLDTLSNPSVKAGEKEAVIDALFSPDMHSFLKVLCENKMIGNFFEIMDAYEELILNDKNIIKAKLSYALKPEQSELDQIKNMIKSKYKKPEVILELQEDPSLIGGFVLYVGNTEYNKSIKGALTEMQKSLI